MTTLAQRGASLFVEHDDRADWGLRRADRAPAGGPVRAEGRRGPVVYPEGCGPLEAEEVLGRLRHIDFPALRGVPLQMGDRIALDLLAAVNGEAPFCDKCGRVKARGRTLADRLQIVGRRCGCGGYYLPGAAMEAAWREWVQVEKD
jgi:hypothetical protein